MRKIFVIVTAIVWMYGSNIEITSQKFEANQKELISKFFGKVVVKKGKDLIKADKVFIYFNKDKKPIKIIAQTDVSFTFINRAKTYKGKAQKVIYYPMKKEYFLSGNVQIVELPDNKKIFAQSVVIDLASNNLSIQGNKKKPVKMIFSIEEK